jgi:hypothetical protein
MSRRYFDESAGSPLVGASHEEHDPEMSRRAGNNNNSGSVPLVSTPYDYNEIDGGAANGFNSPKAAPSKHPRLQSLDVLRYVFIVYICVSLIVRVCGVCVCVYVCVCVCVCMWHVWDRKCSRTWLHIYVN